MRGHTVILALLLTFSPAVVPPPVLARLQPRRWAPSSGEAKPNRESAPSWPRRHVLDLAVRAWQCGRSAGAFHSSLLTIIDYSLPSTERRLWVIDLLRKRVLFHEFVAHGRNTGENFAFAFSNRPGSLQSSLGLFRTGDVYHGRHGLSLRLVGLEPGFNDRATRRAIVMHGARYVSPSFIARHGRLGRSWGCPAVAPAVNERIVHQIKDGTAFFVYYPDDQWLRESEFLSCDDTPGSLTRIATRRSLRDSRNERDRY